MVDVLHTVLSSIVSRVVQENVQLQVIALKILNCLVVWDLKELLFRT